MGKHHYFDVDDACVHGITPAIVLNEVKWLLANRGVMTLTVHVLDPLWR